MRETRKRKKIPPTPFNKLRTGKVGGDKINTLEN